MEGVPALQTYASHQALVESNLAARAELHSVLVKGKRMIIGGGNNVLTRYAAGWPSKDVSRE